MKRWALLVLIAVLIGGVINYIIFSTITCGQKSYDNCPFYCYRYVDRYNFYGDLQFVGQEYKCVSWIVAPLRSLSRAKLGVR